MKKFFSSIKKGWNITCSKIAGLFNRAKKTTKNTTRKVKSSDFWILVSMQLKDKWNFSFKGNKKAAIFKIITYIVIFAALCAFAWFVMYIAAVKLQIFSSSSIPISAMVVILTIVTIFEFLAVLIELTKNLYFAKDNAVLITYPVKANTLFLSKLVVYFFDGVKKGFVLFVPILVGFGIIKSFPFYYYLWIVLWVVVYIAVITLICGFLSLPSYYIMRFLRKYRIVKILLSVVVLGLLVWLCLVILKAIPNNINIIREYEKFSKALNDFLNSFSKNNPIMVAVTGLFCGTKNGLVSSVMCEYSWIVPLCFLGIGIVFVFINLYVSKPFYIRMISNVGNYKPHSLKNKKNIKSPNSFLSILRYETLRNFRDEKIIISSLIFICVTPLIMILINKFYCSFNVDAMGVRLIITFNYLFLTLLATAHNFTSSYIFSKDGPSWNINKSIPVNPQISLTLRLSYNFVISLLIIIPGAIVFASYQQASPTDTTLLIFSILFLTTFHSFLSASFDFMHSSTKTIADIGSEYIEKHVTVSMIYSLFISVITSALIFGLTFLSTPNVFLRIAIASFCLMALEIWLFLKRIRGLYRES